MGPVPQSKCPHRHRQDEAVEDQVTGMKVDYEYRCRITNLRKDKRHIHCRNCMNSMNLRL